VVVLALVALYLTAQTAQEPYMSEIRYAQYPAKPEQLATPTLQLRSKESRLYRTRLREAAGGGVNFAGHYAVGEWGCGTCCVQFGIIDMRSGAVWMPSFGVQCGTPVLSSENPVLGQAGLY